MDVLVKPKRSSSVSVTSQYKSKADNAIRSIISDLNLKKITGFSDLNRRMVEAVKIKAMNAKYPGVSKVHYDGHLRGLIKLAKGTSVPVRYIKRNEAISYSTRKGYDISMLQGLPGAKHSELKKPYYKYVMYKSIFWELHKKHFQNVRKIAPNGCLVNVTTEAKSMAKRFSKDLKAISIRRGKNILRNMLLELEAERLTTDYNIEYNDLRKKHYSKDENLAAYMVDREKNRLSHYTQSHTILLECIRLLMKMYKKHRPNKTPTQKMKTYRSKNGSGIRKRKKDKFISKYRTIKKYKKYTDTRLAKEFGHSRNTIAKWKKVAQKR